MMKEIPRESFNAGTLKGQQVHQSVLDRLHEVLLFKDLLQVLEFLDSDLKHVARSEWARQHVESSLRPVYSYDHKMFRRVFLGILGETFSKDRTSDFETLTAKYGGVFGHGRNLFWSSALQRMSVSLVASYTPGKSEAKTMIRFNAVIMDDEECQQELLSLMTNDQELLIPVSQSNEDTVAKEALKPKPKPRASRKKPASQG